MKTVEGPKIKKVIDSALNVAREYISKKPDTIISIEEGDKDWIVVVEVLERKVIPGTQDLLGRYEIKLDKKGELLGWKQTLIRVRSDRIDISED